jgi:hypothetical protein
MTALPDAVPAQSPAAYLSRSGGKNEKSIDLLIGHSSDRVCGPGKSAIAIWTKRQAFPIFLEGLVLEAATWPPILAP